jgi:3-isopropylmalate/(R)-2-methylmalate dehydratase large subunit
MGKTFAEKVLARAAGVTEATPSQVLDVYPDLYMSPNASWRCIRTMEKLGTDQIYDVDRIAMVMDHRAGANRQDRRRPTHLSRVRGAQGNKNSMTSTPASRTLVLSEKATSGRAWS